MSQARKPLWAKRSLLIVLGVVFLGGLALLVHPVRRTVRIQAQTTIAHMSKPSTASFPQIPVNTLTPFQQRIVSLSRQEYAKKPVSHDTAVLTYTQGSKEPWCADFASWIFKQAGQPFVNPNSGSWRIPGVYTLQDYFQAQHRYRTATSTYIPRTGDVAIYSKGQGHTAIVLSARDNTLTTIGGNENGHLRIDTHKDPIQTDGLIGFGTIGS